jgi:UDP-glucose 4-epimerase
MKIIVTGGAGFIGSHVVDRYIEQGHQVLVIDNLSTGKEEYVNPKAELRVADITDRDKIKQIVNQFNPDVINHHAAHIRVGYSVENPQYDAEHNIIGLLNVMEAAKNIELKKVIMAATGGAMYGDKQTPFDESMKEEPLSPYGISKRADELYLNYYHEQYGIPYISLRYANVYGPRQNAKGESGVVAVFSQQISEGKQPIINGDGTHTRDYVYVSDVAHANELALNSDFVGELNIGTGREISTNQVFQMVCKAMNADVIEKHGPERPGEQVTSSLDATNAGKILGWKPTVDFEEGLKKTASWYRNTN